MISFLRGRVRAKQPGYIILEVAGVGYQVFIGDNLAAELKLGVDYELFTHHRVREEASDLYGFKTMADLQFFELLLTVSGVGPKSALGVLAIASPSDIKAAIVRGDANLLTKVSGIGKKTAERVVLELKTKINRLAGGNLDSDQSALGGSDEIDALMSLGYSLADAREALNKVDPSLTDAGARLKAALKQMRRS